MTRCFISSPDVCLTFQNYLSTSSTAHLGCLIGLSNLCPKSDHSFSKHNSSFLSSCLLDFRQKSYLISVITHLVFSCGSEGKESAYNVRNRVRSLGGEDPLEKAMVTHSSILARESHGQRSLVGYSSWGHKELDSTEWLTHTNIHDTFTLSVISLVFPQK